jgi:hypothetical protein
MSPRLTLPAILLALLAAPARAHDLANYEEDVKPILNASCSCHLNAVVSGVELTTFESILASRGEQYGGPIVLSGDPDASPLIDKIANDAPRHGLREPQGAPPLTDPEIALIRRWVFEGARKAHHPFHGDSNADDRLNLTDAVFTLNFLFVAGPRPRCDSLADANADGEVNLTDAVFVLNFLFLGGPEPRELTEAEDDACRQANELSFASIQEKVFKATGCASFSCHSPERHRAGLDLSTAETSYAGLVGVQPENARALAKGVLLVDPGKPESSFLLTKLQVPGPGEGTRMPANSREPLSAAMIGGIREWILAGAPNGPVAGVPDIVEEAPPPIGQIPVPPPPENGIQLHLQPFSIGPRAEREIFFFFETPFAGLAEDPIIERIDIHMSDESHHFIIYEWVGGGRPPAGLRPLEGVVDVLGTHRFLLGAQQAYFSQSFPPGVGLKMSRNASLDLNSHYLNLNSSQTLLGEVYVNIYFADPGEVTTLVKPIFDINPFINVPPHQTVTTKFAFPGFTSTQQDPAIGSAGKVTRETHIYGLSSHMHRHGRRFSVFLIEQGRDVNPPQMIYDNLDWDDPRYQVFDPPLVLKPGQGLRHETTHTYDDPPSDNAPPLRFAETSEDEMAILLGFYAIK